jgi:hypothetical protein
MPDRAGLVVKAQDCGGQWRLGWRELGMCLSAQPQPEAKEATEEGRLEARLEVLRQRRVLWIVLRWRGQRLRGWSHQRRHWSRCCRSVSKIWLKQMRHFQTSGWGCWLARGRGGRSWLIGM